MARGRTGLRRQLKTQRQQAQSLLCAGRADRRRVCCGATHLCVGTHHNDKGSRPGQRHQCAMTLSVLSWMSPATLPTAVMCDASGGSLAFQLQKAWRGQEGKRRRKWLPCQLSPQGQRPHQRTGPQAACSVGSGNASPLHSAGWQPCYDWSTF